jgi:hypothetical protein
VKQYQQNIVAFLRFHRAVAGGISAAATRHFDKLAKYSFPPFNLLVYADCLDALHPFMGCHMLRPHSLLWPLGKSTRTASTLSNPRRNGACNIEVIWKLYRHCWRAWALKRSLKMFWVPLALKHPYRGMKAGVLLWFRGYFQSL